MESNPHTHTPLLTFQFSFCSAGGVSGFGLMQCFFKNTHILFYYVELSKPNTRDAFFSRVLVSFNVHNNSCTHSFHYQCIYIYIFFFMFQVVCSVHPFVSRTWSGVSTVSTVPYARDIPCLPLNRYKKYNSRLLVCKGRQMLRV